MTDKNRFTRRPKWDATLVMTDTKAAQSIYHEETITIVGVGLLGGSIAAAIRRRNLARTVIGVGRNRDRLDEARRAGIIDQAATDLADAASRSGLLIFCTPVELIAEGVLTAASRCQPGTLLTDAGSIKGKICRDVNGTLPEQVDFIGSHPLAGSEKRGFEHADAELLDGRVCVVTPETTTPPDQLARLTDFWTALGARVVQMPADEHDAALACTSHVPHVVAAALASTLRESNRPLAATGFRDSTRIAAGDPDLWVGILLNNAEEVVNGLDTYSDLLIRFRQAIAERDESALRDLLQIAKTNRDALTVRNHLP